MAKRFIFDGGPGSGKTTLLRGRGQNPSDTHIDCLADRGFFVCEEAIGEVIKQMRNEGKPVPQHFQELLDRALEIEINIYNSTADRGIVLHDKALPGYEFLSEIVGAGLNEQFYRRLDEWEYSKEVFLCRPIMEFDFPQSKDKRRIYTSEMRLRMHERLSQDYSKRGFRVIDVPVYSADFQENNRRRMELVAPFIR